MRSPNRPKWYDTDRTIETSDSLTGLSHGALLESIY